MPTYAEKIDLAREQVSSLIVEITVDPQPSYQDQGRSVQWGEYLSILTDRLDKLNELAAGADGPILIRSRGR